MIIPEQGAHKIMKRRMEQRKYPGARRKMQGAGSTDK